MHHIIQNDSELLGFRIENPETDEEIPGAFEKNLRNISQVAEKAGLKVERYGLRRAAEPDRLYPLRKGQPWHARPDLRTTRKEQEKLDAYIASHTEHEPYAGHFVIFQKRG